MPDARFTINDISGGLIDTFKLEVTGPDDVLETFREQIRDYYPSGGVRIKATMNSEGAEFYELLEVQYTRGWLDIEAV